MRYHNFENVDFDASD